MSKNARIKFKPIEQMNIYDIVSIYILSKISDKLYMVIDDRNHSFGDSDILPTIEILRLYGIKIETIIKYTNYLNVALIYLHILINTENVILESNSFKRMIDKSYNLLLVNNKIKIYLRNFDNTTNPNNILYDNGWIRGLFLDIIIDDCENILYTMYDAQYNTTENNIKEKLVSLLRLNKSTPLNDDVNIHIDILRSQANKRIMPNNKQLYFDNVPLNILLDARINIDDIVTMILKEDVSVDNYMVVCDSKMHIDDKYEPNKVYCIIDPLVITINKSRCLVIGNNKTELNEKIFINSEFNISCSKIKLKYAGLMELTIVNTYTNIGNWCKNKKKNIRQCTDWIPYMNDNVFCYTDRIGNKNHIMVIFPQVSINRKIFKIQNNYYYSTTESIIKLCDMSMRLLKPFM